MKISYGITVHNEAEELQKLLEILIHKTDPEDEIVICIDGNDEKVQEVITSWVQQYGSDDVDKKKEATSIILAYVGSWDHIIKIWGVKK